MSEQVRQQEKDQERRGGQNPNSNREPRDKNKNMSGEPQGEKKGFGQGSQRGIQSEDTREIRSEDQRDIQSREDLEEEKDPKREQRGGGSDQRRSA